MSNRIDMASPCISSKQLEAIVEDAQRDLDAAEKIVASGWTDQRGIAFQLAMQHRDRAQADLAAAQPKQKKQKKESRAARWSRLASEAYSAIEALKEVQGQFEEWRENLPENLQSSALGEKLETICDLDLEGALETLDEAQNADVPLGFGRD